MGAGKINMLFLLSILVWGLPALQWVYGKFRKGKVVNSKPVILATFVLSGFLLVLSEKADRKAFLEQLETRQRLYIAEESIEELQPPEIKRRIINALDRIGPVAKRIIREHGSQIINAQVKPPVKDLLRQLAHESNGRLIQVDDVADGTIQVDVTSEGTFVHVKFWVSEEIFVNPDEPYTCEIPEGSKESMQYLYDQFATFSSCPVKDLSGNDTGRKYYVINPKN